MTHSLSVAHLTAITLGPPDFIAAAADAGFPAVGLRLLPATPDGPAYPLMDDPAALRATRAMMHATGVAVKDIEFLRLTPDLQIAPLAPMLDTAAMLGARRLIAAPYDDDLSRMAARLAELASLAEPRGITVVLEFFPWTVIPDLAACWRLVQQVGPKIGILVDSLHFDRSTPDHALLRSLPAERLPFAHLCDAMRQRRYTTDQLLHTARAERLPPGRGQIDLRAFIAALPPQIDLAVEVPMTQRQQAEGAVKVLKLIHAETTAFLAGMG